ncbi:hypothetical protein pipiens_004903 [Culex pipiens pipiens]|uniref:Uncharacterized protein n=1 Tax=Culex pipiens pipiens TaxID=38569 RepID=A0ABD1CE72_CULPP
MLCHYQLLVCYLSCLVADCWSSTSEYLIIRHGRSRVRHSSEKDHIRWGLQVFDNFTLLDYDTVDDSNETMSGSGAGGNHKSPSPRTNGRPGGGGQFLDNGNNSDTLTIQFSESEELGRMIDISDFDSISTSRRQSKNNRTLNFPFGVDSAQSSTRFAPVATPMPPVLPPTKPAVQLSKKLIKKEIMENIRKTVDKGLQYLKSHKNLDEVKIELKPFRERPMHVPGGGRSIDAETTTHEKVIPSHDLFFDERRKNEPKHVVVAGFDGNRKEHIQVSSPFSPTSTETPTGPDLDDEGGFQSVAYLEEKYWKSVKINDDPSFPAKQFPASTQDDKDYPNDFPPAQHASSESVPLDTLNEASPEQQIDKKIVLSMEAIKSETGSENNAQQQKFNYDQQKQTLHPLLTLQNDGPVDEVGVPDGDEVINILNDTPAMNFDPNGAPATMIFSSDPDSSDPDSPPVWVADAGNPVDDSSSYGTGGSAAVVVETGDIFHMDDLDLNEMDETSRNNRRNLMRGRDVVTQFLWIVESQHLLGSNCTAGTALNLGEGVVDQYAQDRFRVEAEIAVNRANMLTRMSLSCEINFPYNWAEEFYYGERLHLSVALKCHKQLTVKGVALNVSYRSERESQSNDYSRYIDDQEEESHTRNNCQEKSSIKHHSAIDLLGARESFIDMLPGTYIFDLECFLPEITKPDNRRNYSEESENEDSLESWLDCVLEKPDRVEDDEDEEDGFPDEEETSKGDNVEQEED